ncbi:MAG TPA: hypothetical protein VL426_01120 [Candidatus Binatia bacterium]|jgi:hypothetical protein|nr:hypothetical protein [Candidatus Binatia bacterium]
MAQPLIGPGDLISLSWQNLRRNIKVYAEFLVWIALLGVVQWAIWVVTRALIPENVLRSAVLALLSLPVALVLAALTAAMIDATARGVQKKPIDVRASMSTGVHKLIPFIWVAFLSSAATLVGFILLVIPGFIFLVWYRFSQNFAVVDDLRGMAAMGASRKLSAGRWWPVFVRIALPTLFFYVAASFVTALAYLLIGSILGDPGVFFGQADVNDLPNTHTLITSVIPQIVNGIALPLFLGSDIILWLELKRTAGRP